mgnify:CR=1 FL=1
MLRHLTFGLGIVFLAIAIVSLGFVAFYQYRFSEKSSYQVSGPRLAQNKEMVAEYLDEGQYIRAYLTGKISAAVCTFHLPDLPPS